VFGSLPRSLYDVERSESAGAVACAKIIEKKSIDRAHAYELYVSERHRGAQYGSVVRPRLIQRSARKRGTVVSAGARISGPMINLPRNSQQIVENFDASLIRHSFCTVVLEMCV
jgi:hypothetical protein